MGLILKEHSRKEKKAEIIKRNLNPQNLNNSRPKDYRIYEEDIQSILLIDRTD